jgi:uncharacterized damage-inducible protein DinB
MILSMDDVDINPGDNRPPEWQTRKERPQQFEASMKKGREALKRATDDLLLKGTWRLRDGDRLLMEQTRYEGIRAGIINHMAHHRGQLTVYVRMCGQKVPARYGSSADETR